MLKEANKTVSKPEIRQLKRECNKCKECTITDGWICRNSGNFYSTGEYSRTIDYFNIHGVSFNQKINSVNNLLDYNTIHILKVLLTDLETPFDYITTLEIIHVLNKIQSRLSNDNNDILEVTPNVI